MFCVSLDRNRTVCVPCVVKVAEYVYTAPAG
jgi:hypothetical protein